VVDLLAAGHQVTVVDDLSTGSREALRRSSLLAGRSCRLIIGDVADRALMLRALSGIDTVFHLAAHKAVGESMEQPERYLKNNLGGMASLIEAMQTAGVRRVVYSSTAAVYGTQGDGPLREDAPLRPESPYGYAKAEGERMLDWMVRCRGWSAVSLRYFNPVGAHPSGLIGEPVARASNLVPSVLVALTEPDRRLTIFGTDYPTPDGTGLRDFIHVCDLSRAHLVALQALERAGHHVYNVGTGRPSSVREVLTACARAAGRDVPFVLGPRRAGDVAVAVADPRRFQSELGFSARLSLDDMVGSAWRWWTLNPQGYDVNEPAGMARYEGADELSPVSVW
jgi:UDP-glucose 4-epimerase